MLDGVLDELHDGLTLEVGERAKAEVTLIVLDSYVAHQTVEFERQTEDVMVVGTVTDDEGTVRFTNKDSFGHFTADGTPVPTVIFYLANTRRKIDRFVIPIFLFSFIIIIDPIVRTVSRRRQRRKRPVGKRTQARYATTGRVKQIRVHVAARQFLVALRMSSGPDPLRRSAALLPAKQTTERLAYRRRQTLPMLDPFIVLAGIVPAPALPVPQMDMESTFARKRTFLQTAFLTIIINIVIVIISVRSQRFAILVQLLQRVFDFFQRHVDGFVVLVPVLILGAHVVGVFARLDVVRLTRLVPVSVHQVLALADPRQTTRTIVSGASDVIAEDDASGRGRHRRVHVFVVVVVDDVRTVFHIDVLEVFQARGFKGVFETVAGHGSLLVTTYHVKF